MNLSKALADLGCEIYGIRLPRFGQKTRDIVRNVAEKIPSSKIDVISVQHEYGLYQGLEQSFYNVLAELKKPVVTTMHSVGNWSVDKVIANVSDRMIVHNEFCKRRFGYPKKTVIIPHGASPTKCPPKLECKKALKVHPPNAPLVGYVGFISSYKGLEFLIEAMRKVNAGLIIGGGWHVDRETDYIMRLKQKSLELLEGKCQWLGYVPDERMPLVYGACEIIAYPSRFCTESGALLMALSHGKAVIASDLPPMREKVKLGALMTFKNVKDLRRKIKRLLKDKELRHKLEDGAKRYCKETSWQTVAKKHVELYKELL